MQWRYTAADASGRDVTGEIDASTERDAVDMLRRRELWVIALQPLAGGAARSGLASNVDPPTAVQRMQHSRDAGSAPRSGSGAMTRMLRYANGSDDAELAVTMRAMSALLGAGVPLDRALAYAAGAGAGADSEVLKSGESTRAFAAIRDAVRGGQSLSAAMTAHAVFPVVFAPTIAAGEASGTLDVTLATLADHLDRTNALRARLRAALLYPALLGVASIVAVIVIMLVVVPRFAALVADAGGALPLSTRILMLVSGAIAAWWWAIAAAAVMVAVGLRQWLGDTAHRRQWHERRLSWPLIGHLERTRAAAAYTGVLATGLKAGVPLLSAMSLSRQVVRNLALSSRLEEAEGRVRTGESISVALAGVLPPLSLRLIEAGEAGGDLAGMAARAADAADAELQRVAGGTVALIEPALILAFGGIVGFVALALLQAIYGLNARTL